MAQEKRALLVRAFYCGFFVTVGLFQYCKSQDYQKGTMLCDYVAVLATICQPDRQCYSHSLSPILTII